VKPDDGNVGDGGLSRREFLERSVKAGVTVSATAALGFALHDDTPPTTPVRSRGETILDYRLKTPGPGMAIVTGRERAPMVQRALEGLGGLGRFVSAGDRVLVKPNVGFAIPPELGATSHPELVGEVVRLCLAQGAAEVVVTDNPVNDAESCFRLTGIEEAVLAAGGKVILPREDQFQVSGVPGGKLLREWPMLLGPFRGVDKVIGLCPAKDHVRSGATLTVKNWYGLLGGRRNLFHQRIHDVMLELAMLVRPTLVILDGVVTMMHNGPTGGTLADLKETRTMAAGTDPVAVDAFGVTLLGRSPRDLPWIRRAAAAGLGTPDYESLKPVRADVG